MPDAPEENDQHKALQIPEGETDADSKEKDRRKDEPPAKSLEQRLIAIGAHHSREMVAHGPKRLPRRGKYPARSSAFEREQITESAALACRRKRQVAPSTQDP